MADVDEISLRPVSLRPSGLGGSNPFSTFGKGAGFAIKAKQQAAASVQATYTAQEKKDHVQIKYTKEYLMKFMEKYMECPIELQQMNIEIVISDEQDRTVQREVLQKVAEEIDERDWRTRTALPTPAAKAPRTQPESASRETPSVSQQEKPQQQERPQQQAAPQQPQEAPQIKRAVDSGLTAYRPGASVSNEQKALRSIKGILNKLTPEKFERLLQQLLEVITTADVLRHTISLVFENAVAQPTFCAMYADLCVHLSKELPSFPPPEGEGRPITFGQILLNTCQDEFEGTENAREELPTIADDAEREAADRRVKTRTLGTIRLISELYKQEMIKDLIITTCISILLGAKKAIPAEDNIEAACEMITIAGPRLSKSDKPETRKKFDDCIKSFEKLSAEKVLASRIRFLIKDVLDLRKANWVPRREVFTAKKLDEIRQTAEAELGMISSTISAVLPELKLPAARGVGARAGGDTDDLLIPPLRGGEDGWAFTASSFKPNFGEGGRSALLGDYAPPSQAAALAADTEVATVVEAQEEQPAVPSVASGGLSDEELERKTGALFQEYCSTLDRTEALTCVRELSAPQFMAKLVEIGIQQMLDSMKEKEQVALMELLVHLFKSEALNSTDVLTGLSVFTVQLEDLSLDVPKAPELLGQLFGLASQAGALPLDLLPEVLSGDFGAEPKREFAAAALKTLLSKVGAATLQALCEKANLKASSFLTADPELDKDAPSVEDWLKSTGLTMVPI